MFVGADVLLKLQLAHVESASSSYPSAPWVPLMVLGAALLGSSAQVLRPHLQLITDTLALPEVCQEAQQVGTEECVCVCVGAIQLNEREEGAVEQNERRGCYRIDCEIRGCCIILR